MIANGNMFVHDINGRFMSIGMNEDGNNFRKTGVLAFQTHSSKPKKVEVKNTRVRILP